MGVDLHRIGLGISSGSSRNGFGNIVSFPSVSFPAYGSVYGYSTGVDYLAGATSVVQSVTYYQQNADYIVRNDGVGGTFVDYASAFNIVYKTGTFVTTTNEIHDGNNVTLPHGLGSYPTQQFSGYDYTWTGSGGYTQYDAGVIQTYSNQIASDYTNTQSTPNGYSVFVYDNYFTNGKYTSYSVSGAASYSAQDNQGSYYSHGTFITGPDNMNQSYYWDGNGGYFAA